jgi:hypothetical protein
MDLGDFHAALFLTPAIVSLFADADMVGSLDDRFALRDQDFRLTEVADDLFSCIALSCQDDPFLNTYILTMSHELLKNYFLKRKAITAHVRIHRQATGPVVSLGYRVRCGNFLP